MNAILAVQIPNAELAVYGFDDGVKVRNVAVHDLTVIQGVAAEANRELKKNALALNVRRWGLVTNAERYRHGVRV